ncbi:AI-2E family transporter [Dysgonomonas sp. 216]|uniref:AI-2E family transporter n=1 Tax=Dysgonomonas sp. 216 TaxID=2302934 RepID=UPI0013D3E913|nr:AI-2E family transporter [Dysgonomonas sp. 216]NDW18600.1 AI-2E family transporter [Dysgonomonas sp. 216]
MKSINEYWKYALITFIIILGIVIFKETLPFLSGILGAFTLYVLVRNQMYYLTEKKGLRKSLAALLIIVEVILIILIPTFLIIWLTINKMSTIDFAPAAIFSFVDNIALKIKDITGYDPFSSQSIIRFTSYATKFIQVFLGQISSFVINAIVLLFILYFMLIGNRSMEAYVYDVLPFNKKNKRLVVDEVKVMVKSNAIGIPLLAIIQGAIATIGYMIFDVPDPILFGFLTCFATIIPLLGTSLVWFPLTVYLGISGNWGAAIGLALYSLIIITNVDNLIRFVLQKQLADTHPLVTVFGVIIGLTLFGFWGVIFGPLLLSLFILCINMFKKQYLDTAKEE